jgi:hypothetical protein
MAIEPSCCSTSCLDRPLVRPNDPIVAFAQGD